jgi:uncharacterized sulfatase
MRRGGYKDFWLASDALEHTSHSYDGHMFSADREQVDFPKDRYRVDCLTDYAVDYLRTRKLERAIEERWINREDYRAFLF